jgi:hypothetical protein
MSLDLRLAKSLSCQGKTFNFSRAATPDGVVGTEPALAAAKTGSLTTRTNNVAGTLTMNTVHGINTADVIDIYWADGVAYKVTVGTVSVNTVPISGASGDALPAANTAITAMVVHEETFAAVATSLQALAVYAAGTQCVARFRDASDVDVAVIVVNPGTEGYVWFTGDDSGSANPFGSTDVANVLLTHGSSGGTITVSAYGYVD